jgi:hypothetical protein
MSRYHNFSSLLYISGWFLVKKQQGLTFQSRRWILITPGEEVTFSGQRCCHVPASAQSGLGKGDGMERIVIKIYEDIYEE